MDGMSWRERTRWRVLAGLVFSVICLLRMGTSDAATPTEQVRSFFENHPNAIDLEVRDDRLLFANRHVGIEFRRLERGFQVTRFYGMQTHTDFLVREVKEGSPNLFEIVTVPDPAVVHRSKRDGATSGPLTIREGAGLGIMRRMAENAQNIGPLAAGRTAFRRTGDASASTLHLEWYGVDVADDKAALDIEVAITLRAGDPFSYWRFNIKNRSITRGIERVRFPILEFAPIGQPQENVYIYPTYRGWLVADPFHQSWSFGEDSYPGGFSMQFQALYNRRTGTGVYFGTFDAAPHFRLIRTDHTTSRLTWQPSHFPTDIGFGNEDFTLAYDCVVRPFEGDWWDVCQIYRKWAVEQRWCSKGPLDTRDDIPKWYKEAPLYLVTDSYASDESVAATRDHYLRFLKWAGMPLPCNWYTWKKYHPGLTTYDVPFNYWRKDYRKAHPCANIHDGNYPRLPALPSLSEACKTLRAAGGMVCPYVCLGIYDQGPCRNAPYANEATPHVARDLYGNMLSFHTETSWAMCAATEWWRSRLTETCVTLLQRENVGGFYLDVMNGYGHPCYWTPHGHAACGGETLPSAMHGLCERIRDAVKALDAQVITSGENAAENMIDVIDGRLHGGYTVMPTSTTPLFAAVYQDYVPRYALGVRANDEDLFYMQAGLLFVEGAQIGRLRLKPMDGGLSFDDPAHKPMLDFLSHLVACYRLDVAKKFLCYGQLMRPLEFRRPAPMPVLRHTMPGRERWYKGGVTELPALVSGVFRARDGELGVFIVNMGRTELAFAADIELQRYGFSLDSKVQVERVSPDGAVAPHGRPGTGQIALEGAAPGRRVIIFRLKTR